MRVLRQFTLFQPLGIANGLLGLSGGAFKITLAVQGVANQRPIVMWLTAMIGIRIRASLIMEPMPVVP